jgi:hypothetical protein
MRRTTDNLPAFHFVARYHVVERVGDDMAFLFHEVFQSAVSLMGQMQTCKWAGGSSIAVYLDGFTPRDRSRNRCAVT